MKVWIGSDQIERLALDGFEYTIDEVRAGVRPRPDTVFVITCNDMVVCVVLGGEKAAEARVEVERKAYFDRNPHSWVILPPFNWNELTPEQRRDMHWQAYRQRCYWAAREVPLHGVTES